VSRKAPARSPVATGPIYWFAVLDRALAASDFAAAARAQGELSRRGYVITYRPRGCHELAEGVAQ
jgi:hypothetical protein